MDLRDYIRLVRRGWALLVVVILVSVSAAALYLIVAPKQYSAGATLLVNIKAPNSVTEAQQGLSSTTAIAATYAGVIDSAVVVGPAVESLRPRVPLDEALSAVSAGARESTGLIDVVAVGPDPRTVTRLANGVAQEAAAVIPELQGRSSRNSPIVLQVIQSAPLPTAPISPDPKQVLSLGLILGVVLGLASTIAWQTLTTRLRRPEDVQKNGLPVLAALPRLARNQRQGIVVADHPNSPAVEAYRTLRTNLSNLESEARRSVLVAPVREDRDPEVPVNIAWSLAQAGRTVLLVDLDLRRAPISELLHLPSGPGLTDLLEQPAHESDVATRFETRHPRVHVITAGEPHPSPSDALSLPRLGKLIRSWESEYDYVVLNAPSLLRYTDAAVVARETGVTLVTVHADRTKAQELLVALGTLRSVRVEPMGAVVTGTRAGTVRENRRLRGGAASVRPRVRDEEVPSEVPASVSNRIPEGVDYFGEAAPSESDQVLGAPRG